MRLRTDKVRSPFFFSVITIMSQNQQKKDSHLHELKKTKYQNGHEQQLISSLKGLHRNEHISLYL